MYALRKLNYTRLNFPWDLRRRFQFSDDVMKVKLITTIVTKNSYYNERGIILL